jgi:hypothetical protein
MTNIRELYNNLIVKLILITKDVLVLEPKHSIVEYGRSHRSNIKFVEGGAENIPLPDEYFDTVVDFFSPCLSDLCCCNYTFDLLCIY